ncbi:MAG: hypothetical protein SVK54_01495 [candidate division WOR-3 bacterium]|nr:hypothetical protein [candidate division WOR-3 bacterium]
MYSIAYSGCIIAHADTIHYRWISDSFSHFSSPYSHVQGNQIYYLTLPMPYQRKFYSAFNG